MLMRIAGIDPSLTDSGIARSDGYTGRAGIEGITKLPIWEQNLALDVLADEIYEQCRFPGPANGEGRVRRLPPELTVIELPSLHSAYGGQLERTGLYWKLVERLRSANSMVVTVTAAQRCQYVLGKGSGVKGQIIEKVTRLWPQFETHGNDNIADALVYLAMGADKAGYPLDGGPIPLANRKVLDSSKIAWPAALLEPPF